MSTEPASSVSFDRAAEFYDETRGFPPRQAAPVAALFAQAAGLTSTSRVLEVGVGTGRVALPLAAVTGARVTGVDISRQMLARLVAKRSTERVMPVEADITRLPLASGLFDAVLAVHVFHLIPGWQGALLEVARVLRPGGTLMVGYDDHRHESLRQQLFALWDTVAPGRRKNIGLPFSAYRTYLIDSGWQKMGESWRYSYTIQRTPREFLSQLERRVWSSMWRMSDEDINAGLAVMRAYLDQQGIDLDEPEKESTTFVVDVYQPPVA